MKVPAVGDCLPHSASVLAYGEVDHPNEMRARIVIELAIHKEMYLDHDYLRTGISITDRQARNLTKTFCMFSDQYVPGMILRDGGTVSEIFLNEVRSVSVPKTFMGIWQLFALANILRLTIISVYPMRGNHNARTDLNRLIVPRERSTNCNYMGIMWT
jgi:hypothetical protein